MPSVVVPTIALDGVTIVPVTPGRSSNAAPAHGDGWWSTVRLAFIRQEQSRFATAMEPSRLSLDVETAAGRVAAAAGSGRGGAAPAQLTEMSLPLTDTRLAASAAGAGPETGEPSVIEKWLWWQGQMI
jgi:hypothetical protein